MPNWCHNRLRVSGPAEAVGAFVVKAKTAPVAVENPEYERPLWFGAFAPEPEFSNDGSGVFPDWYRWRVEHWGTKWDASFKTQPLFSFGTEESDPDADRPPLSLEPGAEGALYQFDTAWGPPEPVIHAMAAQHPELSFEFSYGEPGMDFGGRLTFEDGSLAEEVSGSAGDFLSEEEMWP